MVWEPCTREDEWRALMLNELRGIRALLEGVVHQRQLPSQLGSTAQESGARTCPACRQEFVSRNALAAHSRWCTGYARKTTGSGGR